MSLVFRLFAIALAVYFTYWLVRWLIRRARDLTKIRWVRLKPTTPSKSTLDLLVASPDKSLSMEVDASKPGGIRGRRLILVSAALMTASLFMDWATFFVLSWSGISLGMAVLSLLWLYPVISAVFKWRVHARTAKWGAALSVLAGLVALGWTANRQVLFLSVNVTGIGVLVYFSSSVLFLIGVSRYSSEMPR